MEGIIQFLRDTLDGPLYIVTVIICVILILACIGYLAERKIKEKKVKEQYASVQENGENIPLQEVGVSPVPPAASANPPQQPITPATPSTVAPILENGATPSVAVVAKEGQTIQPEPPTKTVVPPIQEVSSVVDSPATLKQENSPSTPVTNQSTVQQETPVAPTPSGVDEQVRQVSPSNVAVTEPTKQAAPSQSVSAPQQNIVSTIPEIVTPPTPNTSQEVQPAQPQVSPAVNVGELSQNSTPSQTPLPVSTNYEKVVAVPVVKVPSAQELK